ncbi:glycoside hydrolase family 16 protein [Melanomma pulvis-pyrius CBS 109.77]|uniref:Glycoside hydrolase family 16 protein n=1 Tax=Melanomma pulvis-pyrius CBS 109.77 TaxID=1314802 RepID=A0A6A6WQ11_9PLEO|nr:glycoside hydrolase family 16 protein [Melanomma pulvis-pyrius CBS 109.77]
MRSDISLPFSIAAAFLLAKVAAECTQFSTNSSTAARYNFYRFYDARNLYNSSKKSAVSESSAQSKTFSTVPWSTGWDARSSFKPAFTAQTLDMQYTPAGVFIRNNTQASQDFSTYISLYTTRLPNGTQQTAALDYAEYNVTHASIRILARVRGASGAVAGFFTYHNDTTESDIEMLTRDPSTQVRYSNQPTEDPQTNEPISGSTFNVSLASQRSTSDWNVHRLDWVQGRSVWYVNDAQAASSEVNVPDTASRITLNLWSNGGNFSGEMGIGDEAWFDVQWIALFFNVTSSPDPQGGGTVCSAEFTPGTSKPPSDQ